MLEENGTRNKPEYTGIMGITSSVRFPENGFIFQRKKGKAQGSRSHIESIISKLSDKLGNYPHSQMLNLYQFMETLEIAKPTNMQGKSHPSEKPHSNGTKSIFSNYDPGYAWTNTMDFGDRKDIDWWNPFSHRDFTSSVKYNGTEAHVVYNEYLVSMDSRRPEQGNLGDYVVAYDILYLNGRERSWVFSRDFSLMMFNLCLPPGRFEPKRNSKESDYKRQVQETLGNFIVVPVIMLNRKQSSERFRRTVSVSMVIVPVGNDFISPRSVTSYEAHHAFNSGKFTLSGDLRAVLENDEFTLNELRKYDEDGIGTEQLMKLIFKRILRAVSESYIGIDRHMDRIDTEVGLSRTVTEAFLDKNLTYEKAERYLNGGELDPENPHYYEELHELIDLQYGVMEEMRKITKPERIDLRWMVVKNTLNYKTDLLFFNSFNRKYVAILPQTSEVFPLSSVKYAFIWGLRLSIGLSSLKTMIYAFYREIENERNAKAIINIENDLVEDADEFYDLDVNFASYTIEYGKAKELAGVERDYRNLKDKLGALKANVLIEDQRRLNQILVLFTGLVMAATIVTLARGFGFLLQSLIGLGFVAIALLLFQNISYVSRIMQGRTATEKARK